MTKISDDAFDLLQTARSRATKTQAGKIITIGHIARWYNEDDDDNQWLGSNQLLIDELLQERLIGYLDKDDPDDGYILLPRGENYRHITTQPSSSTVTNNFGDINNSNIANMSSDIHQSIDMSNYSVKIQNEVTELREAIEAKDSTRAKRIIDGLWVSAPQLVLTLLQIGLSVRLGAN